MDGVWWRRCVCKDEDECRCWIVFAPTPPACGPARGGASCSSPACTTTSGMSAGLQLLMSSPWAGLALSLSLVAVELGSMSPDVVGAGAGAGAGEGGASEGGSGGAASSVVAAMALACLEAVELFPLEADWQSPVPSGWSRLAPFCLSDLICLACLFLYLRGDTLDMYLLCLFLSVPPPSDTFSF